MLQCPEASSLGRAWRCKVGQSNDKTAGNTKGFCSEMREKIEKNKLFSKPCVCSSTAKTVERA